MGGTVEYVYWQGQRLTAWMLYVLTILDQRLWDRWRVRLVLVSAIRLYVEQVAIFLRRYVRYADINGRRVYDTRWWNGARWYRIDPIGTVAPPRTSNHEIQGDVAAVDIKDTGADPGITSKNSERGRWLRQVFEPEFGMDPEGDNFAEGWHHRMRGIFRTPPTIPASDGGSLIPEPAPVPEEEDDTMKIFGYKNPEDGNRTYYVEMDSTSGFWNEWASTDEKYIQSYAAKWAPLGIPLFSLGHRNGLKAECDRVAGRAAK